MHGKVLSILVEKGDAVTRGNVLPSSSHEDGTYAGGAMDGTVAEIAVAQDAQVGEGAKVMVIEATSGNGVR